MRKQKSEILEAVSDTARGLHRAGVMDRLMLREFDRLCLPPISQRESYTNELLEAWKNDEY